MTDLITKTGVRQSIDGVNVGSDFYEAIGARVEKLVRRRKQQVLETGEMPEERKVVRVDELNALLGDVSQRGCME